MQLVNGAQSLNAIPLSLSSASVAAASSPSPVIVIFPLEGYMHHYNHIC